MKLRAMKRIRLGATILTATVGVACLVAVLNCTGRGEAEDEVTEKPRSTAGSPRTGENSEVLRAAIRLHNHGRYYEAIQMLEAIPSGTVDDSEVQCYLVRCYDETDQLEQKLQEYERAAASKPENVVAQWTLGYAYYVAYNRSQAAKQFSRVLKLDAKHAYSYNYLGNIYSQRKQFSKAEKEYRKAFASDLSYGMPHVNLGLAYARQGKREKAIEEYKKAQALDPDCYMAHNNLGALYMGRGRYDEAIEELKAALRISPVFQVARGNLARAYNARIKRDGEGGEQAGPPGSEDVPIYVSLGERHRKEKEYAKAVEYFKKALEIDPNHTYALRRMARIYASVDDEAKEQEYYKRVIPIYEELGDKDNLCESYRRLGWTYCELQFNRGVMGNADKAMDCFEKALKLAIELGDRDAELKTLRGIAGVHGDMYGDKRKAISLDLELIEKCKRYGNRYQYMMAISSIGTEHMDVGEWDTAIKYLEEALPYWEGRNSLNMINWTQGKLAQCYRVKGQQKEAYEASKKTVETMEEIRSGLKTDEFKMDAVGGRWIWRYRGMVYDAFMSGKETEAFDTIEMVKARALLDLLGGKKFDSRRELLTERDKEEKLLLAKIDTLKEQISRERELLSGEVVTRMERTLKLEQSKYEKLREDIENCKAEIESLETVKPMGLEDVQEFIEDFTFVQYFVASGRSYWCVVSKDNFAAGIIEANQHVRREKVDNFRKAVVETAALQRGLKLEVEEGKEPKAGNEKKLSQELYDLLMKPVLPHVKTRTVYISPDNMLNYLPFHALQNEGRYLAEDYAIAYTPSASVLNFCLKRRKQGRETILAFGNPNLKDPRFKLVHAAEEVETIAKRFPKSRVFLDNDANEYTVKMLGSDYDILHFACHGQLNPDDPMLSSLRLAPDKENDGYLHVREIFDLNLNASLVTLSACETALGEVTLGNEVVGLTRAFLFAGTPSVVSTLWKIDDESTAELMDEFYQNLQTMTKVEALRKAQLSMIAKGKAPYYWSAFCLFGDYM